MFIEQQDKIRLITFDRTEKHNAFDEVVLTELQQALDDVKTDPNVRVIILKSHGKHFSAGADIGWMKRMATFSEEENLADAQILARVMLTLYQTPIPTIAMVQGCAFGGGAGLVAACDIGIAAHSATFCFSEVKLGLIPAVISPYVIGAIGARAATGLFMSGDTFDAKRAFELQLVQHCVEDDKLLTFTLNYAQNLAQLPQEAVREAKALVRQVQNRPIDETLQQMTASLIANKRKSTEAQLALQAFLNKRGASSKKIS